MTNKEVLELLKRFERNQCTEEEKLLLFNYYDELDRHSADPGADFPLSEMMKETWHKLETERFSSQLGHRQHSIYRFIGAAAALLLMVGGVYYAMKPKPIPDIYVYNQAHDVMPGGNKAVLTLADGKQIALDSLKEGTIASQAGVTITKNANGQLVYVISSGRVISSVNGKSLGAAYNTISTPKGGQYEVYLPDGSHVYLNAASNLKYPIKFNGTSRTVALMGEAYFEITKNEKPFIVSSEGQSVKVLGTHFNVASYPDEPIVTTLAEGKIELSSSSFPQKTILKPGEQSTAMPDRFNVKQVDVEGAIAWKDGLFVFNQSSIKTVLRQIARWYDVEVDYNSLPEDRFDGEIGRDFPLSELLKAIEKTNNIKLKIEGRTIKVIK